MSALNIERLILCRKQLGITKQEAAQRMHLSQPAYLRYESGQRTPSIHVIQTMAYVLETSAQYLMGETENLSPDIHVISREDDKVLFDFINIYKSSSSDYQKHLRTYLEKAKTL